MKKNRHLLILSVFFVTSSLSAQTKEDFKKQKSQIEKEIRYTTTLLNKTKSNKTKSLNYLKALENQIKNKEQLLSALNIETSLLNKKIKKTKASKLEVENSIISEEKKIKKLKDEYAKMVYAAFKKKGKKNNMMFIVSATDFNQAYKRILYLKQYSEHRKKQAIKIEEIQNKLTKKKENLTSKKDILIQESANKKFLLTSKKEELESVKKIKNEKNELLKRLSKSEKFFKNKILEKQKKAKDIEDKIRKIIEEEILKSREKNINNNYNLTPEALALSSEFSSNKGKLPWPLKKGVIIGRYGKQKHIIFGAIETFNNGIDIATDKNAEVRTVFDGTVSRIFFIKGEGKAILINHGEYFSVYSGLKEVTVKTGDKLFSKEKIGVVITQEDENKTELHFEIWKGYDKQDPSGWIYKAY